VGSCARLHADQRWRLLAEERLHLAAPQLPCGRKLPAGHFRYMHLKDIFGEIEADAKLTHVNGPSFIEGSAPSLLAHCDAARKGRSHHHARDGLAIGGRGRGISRSFGALSGVKRHQGGAQGIVEELTYPSFQNDAALREIYLSRGKRNGRTRAAAPMRWSNFLIRLGIKGPMRHAYISRLSNRPLP
jgi:hypothetical protein